MKKAIMAVTKSAYHHGRHEVGIGHFPRPTVVTFAFDDFLPLDDDWRGI